MIKLKTDVEFGNKISFSEEYKEKVLLRHFLGLYSNFELIIKPTDSNIIRLYSENQEANRFWDRISHGIRDFIDLYIENDISVNGFDVITSNDKFHAIDSKPITYQIPIINALKRIFTDVNTQRTIVNPKLEGKNYSFQPQLEKKKYRNVEWDEVSTRENIRFFQETKYLNTNGLVKISNCDIDFYLESNINEGDTRSQNSIKLRFKKEEFTPNQMVDYLRIVELIISDEYKNKINLSGFILYFEKNNLQVDLFDRKGENIVLEWAIRNLLSSEKTIKIIKEADR